MRGQRLRIHADGNINTLGVLRPPQKESEKSRLLLWGESEGESEGVRG